ncbi:proton pump-interactor 1-like [Quillaja saponaria]|uniref:Proton pump-interactor 1-like n=1 Tax=Quillaja saponaria TaxID=32244 RepID=A0AAD7QH84_QUISA|nr:proton pump-interactor 1-like [Quillaja saponaria]
MEELKTSLIQEATLLENEGDNNIFPENEYAQHIVNAGHGPKQVLQFYFVKIWPTDANSVSRIEEAEKLIAHLNRVHFQIIEKINQKVHDKNQVYSKMEKVNYYYRSRGSSVVDWLILSHLNSALDELSFANNSHHARAVKPCSTDELDNHELNFRMLHGSRSLAEENQLLRQSRNQKEDITLFSSVEKLHYNIKSSSYYMKKYEGVIKEIENFELSRAKANSKDLKEAIRKQIKLMCAESGDTMENRKRELARRIKLRRFEKELQAINKHICSLQKQLKDLNKRKDEEYQCILKLRKEHNKENSSYYRYCSLLKNAKQLAEQKDLASLQKLSLTQVHTFMRQWNKSKEFRENYIKTIMPSLASRQLQRDGMRSNHSV